MSCDRSDLLTQQLLPQRLRDRACSRDCSVDTAFPSSSSSSPSLQTTLKQFPSKAQTADDSSLSSTEGQYPKNIEFGAPRGNTNDQANLYRRRSHRPRGCRGGRKNRKKQLAKSIGVLLPKDILGPHGDSNRPIRTDTYDQNSRSEGCSSGLVDCSEEGPNSFTQATIDENCYLVGRGLTTPFQSVSEGNPTAGGLICGVFYPQRALIATSQGAPEGLTTQAQADSGMLRDNRSMNKPMSKMVREILPPPPSVRAEPHETRFEGPNPYALTASKLGDRPIIMEMMNHSSCATVQSNQLNHVASLGNDSARVNDVHAVVESDGGSGSLFATSPRSFLMGFDVSTVDKGDQSASDSW
jgi:hypothetical protein